MGCSGAHFLPGQRQVRDELRRVSNSSTQKPAREADTVAQRTVNDTLCCTLSKEQKQARRPATRRALDALCSRGVSRHRAARRAPTHVGGWSHPVALAAVLQLRPTVPMAAGIGEASSTSYISIEKTVSPSITQRQSVAESRSGGSTWASSLLGD